MASTSSDDGKVKSPGIWILALGLASMVLGVFTALPGLIWCRRLRPFDRLTRFGYYLCWLSITVGATVVFFLIFMKGGLVVDWTLQAAVYLFVFAVWVALAAWLFPAPAPSIKAALLISLAGSLCVAPSVVAGEWGVRIWPAGFGLGWWLFFDGRYSGQAGMLPLFRGNDLAFWYAAFIGLLSTYPAFLAVYWPRGEAGAH